ncbi:asparaginase [Verticiella sediminum]|uniref:Asparaginase n=1 Tax=Verticiella sediminum TaxID=1247510 RepID=A0A556B1G2_9BURK|nr:asparaginase [Verticiella sediminum]TSH99010.1 asparaginase [Verticiella sediminum]
MTLPRISVASLGGTISSTAADAASGVVPRLDAAQLVASVPGLANVAQIHAEPLFQLPSASIGFAECRAALAWAQAQVDAGAAGVVLTQGTDSIEETAFLLDLYWQRAQPLVVTGAMRSPQAAGADGPANLLAAVLAAGEAASRKRGVLVVMNDTVHAARWVRKRHTLAVQAFESPETGPVGAIIEGGVRFLHPAAPRLAPLPAPVREARVALLQAGMGDDGTLALLARDAGYDGIVIAGFGSGHVPYAYAQHIDDIAARIPVVIASRTGAGPTTRATYGYVGSEIDLIHRGAFMAGWLEARKARLLLWALLAGGADKPAIADALHRYGAAPLPG